MKKNTRRPRPKPLHHAKVAGGGGPSPRLENEAGSSRQNFEAAKNEAQSERKVGVVSNTAADILDEVGEHKADRWIAIYISILAVLLAIGATGSNDAMKNAQQAGFQVNDSYAFYQAKQMRQGSLKLTVEQLKLEQAKAAKPDSLPEAARQKIEADLKTYQTEIDRLESNDRNGKKELLAKAQNCENERAVALRAHPFYDYSQAMLQIAIVLASASIVAGARLLLGASGLVGILGILFLINGYTLVFGAPEPKLDKVDAVLKSVDPAKREKVQVAIKCLEE